MVFPVPFSVPGGQLPNVAAALVTAPPQSPLTVQITLVNTSAGALTFNLYMTRNSALTSQLISPKACNLAANSMYETIPFTLFPGDSISGDASAATSIDYTLTAFQYAA